MAAALLILVVLSYSWLARMLRDASARAESAERYAAQIRREGDQQIASIERKAAQVSDAALRRATQAERIAAIVAAPDARRMSMRGYGRAVGASGQALWSSSRGVVIDGSQLPVLSDRETYQVWLVTPEHSVSLGLLAPDSAGRINGVFELPPGLPSPKGFMITREPAGGATRPSAAVVLAT